MSTTDPAMPPPSSRLPLTLIVAATPALGIGKNGTLPWPQLKKEMAYFARVTKRSPAIASRNAVIMGRKTWTSIPPRFRPLKDRLNVVVSRSGAVEGAQGPDVLVAGSLEGAVRMLEERRQQRRSISAGTERLDADVGVDADADAAASVGLGRVYVIGGAALYKSALELAQTKYVLLTKIWEEFECDTIFPIDLEGEGRKKGWVRRGNEDLSRFVGEEVPVGRVKEGVEFEFCLYEKVEAE